MNKECNLIIGQNSLIKRGQFEIHHFEGESEIGQIIEKKGDLMFINNGSLGEDFVATGIVNRSLAKNEKILLVRHPDDKFSRIEL